MYDNGKFYVNYVKVGNGQLQYLGVFDVKKDFASLVQVQIQEKPINLNHVSFEVSGHKAYVFFREKVKTKPYYIGKSI